MVERFFFHLSDGNQTLIDNEGIELASTVAARERMTCHGISIVENLSPVVDVTNGDGVSIMTSPFVADEHAVSQLDPLTGLLGRIAFLEHVSRLICDGEASSQIGLLLFDLDGLKETNHAFGFDPGDAALKHVAASLRETNCANRYAVGRLAGSTFALVLPELVKSNEAFELAEAIQVGLHESFQYCDDLIFHSVSAGLAVSPEHGLNDIELLASAEIALHMAKAGGGGSLVVYAPGMKLDRMQRFESLEEARSALADGRLVPHYQPKVSLESGLVCGFEALLRLNHIDGGVLPPSVIAEALDDPEFSVDIGREIQERVFDDVSDWRKSCVNVGTIAINVSPVELLFSSYATDLLKRLRSRAIPPDQIQVEITETAMTGRGAAKIIGELQKLRASGVSVFLDDFGTGYNSLVHLRKFPINGFKLDKSFIKDALHEEAARRVITVIIHLARELDLLLVIEGVETEKQAAFLRKAGCEVAQGYLYARAMPADVVADYLKAKNELLPNSMETNGYRHEDL